MGPLEALMALVGPFETLVALVGPLEALVLGCSIVQLLQRGLAKAAVIGADSIHLWLEIPSARKPLTEILL